MGGQHANSTKTLPTKRKIFTIVRPHYRRPNAFVASGGAFAAGGISRKHGPYTVVGYGNRRATAKTSIGMQGHMASFTVRPTKNTGITFGRNLTTRQNSVGLRYKRLKISI